MKDEKVFRWHPMIGKKSFTKEEAERLDEVQKRLPSGWVVYAGQDIQPSSPDADGSSNQIPSNAFGTDTDQGNPEDIEEQE